ncbi:MAG: prolyl oligopeptidase family serine peptidase [Burkholderiaceae bacterium]
MLALLLVTAAAPTLWAQPADPFLWLEDIDSPRALAWVDEQSGRAEKLIEAMPGFEARYKATLTALTTRAANIQFPSPSGGHVYNHYRTANQPSGVWRRATLEGYQRKPRPDWQMLLDIDALAREEQVPWVWGGAEMQPTAIQGEAPRALVRLSRGGSDAAVFREFDIGSRSFVAGGFTIPESKSWAAWLNADELLVADATDPTQLTSSGYALVVRRWKRGTPLAQAPVVLTAQRTDMSAAIFPGSGAGGQPEFLLARRTSFHRWVYEWFDGKSHKPLAVPAGAYASIDRGMLLIRLMADWEHQGRKYAAGSLVMQPAAQFAARQGELRVVYEPRERSSLYQWATTQDDIVINELHELNSRLTAYPLAGGPGRVLPLPGEGLARIWSQDKKSPLLWLSFESYLQPQSLSLLDASTGVATVVDETSAGMDLSGHQAVRMHAKSRDGTPIPYTVISRKDAPRDGKQPTLLYGYGGFGISELPAFQRLPALNWLSAGGTYVIANIRGGGEFGQAWTDAAKGPRRQTGFDDFAAVAQALSDEKITSPAHLGIYGASNGGLLVSTVAQQRPELFGAVVSRVPLTDMQRYAQLLAGASWIEEYGDPARPEDWAVLSRYSPYQNASAATKLPKSLYITNRNDDRVHPGHGRKMVARLQSLGQDALLFEPRDGGHAGRATPQSHARREALIYTFLLETLRPKP